jgi:hypothetical protein
MLLTPLNQMEQIVPKRRHIKFRTQGITQQKEHKMQNTAKVLNQEKAVAVFFNKAITFVMLVKKR